MYKHLLFDLDGTLWDPAAPIATAWNRVVENNKTRFRTITNKDIRSIAGLPHDECVRRVFSGLDEKTHAALNDATQAEDRAIFAGPLPLFNGVRRGLLRLSAHFGLLIVSNCQKHYIESFLTASHLSEYFIGWECWGNTGRDKADNIRSVVSKHAITQAAFIGDTWFDEAAATACGLPYYHCSYGYGQARSPRRTFSTFSELTDYFLKSHRN